MRNLPLSLTKEFRHLFLFEQGTSFVRSMISMALTLSLIIFVCLCSICSLEADEKLSTEREALQASLDKWKGKLGKKLTAKEEFGQNVETRLQDKENAFSIAVQKNDKLKRDLSSVKKVC